MINILRTLRRSKPAQRLFGHAPNYSFIYHKFYYGQGAHLTLDLTRRNYSIQFDTIWEDYSQVHLQGLTGSKNFEFRQQGRNCVISDKDLAPNHGENIVLKLRIPENFTYKGEVYGSVRHQNSDQTLSSKVVGDDFQLKLLASSNSCPVFEAQTIQGTSIKILNPKGTVKISSLLAGKAVIGCENLEAKKLAISENVSLKIGNTCSIRSLIMQDSEAKIEAGSLNIESIMGGSVSAEARNLRIDRLYGQKGRPFTLRSTHQHSVSVETGSGVVYGNGELKLGRMHKGRITNVTPSQRRIELI